MSTQPEALRLADYLDDLFDADGEPKQAAAELRRLHQHELANIEWMEKTHWVQDSAEPKELGLHRADVIKGRMNHLRALNQELLASYCEAANAAKCLELQRDELLEALQSYSLAIDVNNIALSCIEFGTEAVERELKRRSLVSKATAPAFQRLPADDTEGGAV